jgi:hypothetical protein
VTGEKPGSASHRVRGGSFNIHVGDSASGKEEREHLIRYCARAPLSLERLSVSEDGKVVYQLKHPIRGRTHRVMEPHQFFARLCALIPPPRHPLIRFFGVFGPASKWRAEVIPRLPPLSDQKESSGSGELGEGTKEESQWHSQRLDWATLLHRVYDIDALRCECGGELRFEELIESSKDAKAFLALHRIESPGSSSIVPHTQPWSDAPNIALVAGQRTEVPALEDKQAWQDVAEQDWSTTLQAHRDDEAQHRDTLPPEYAYFRDEIPPD